MWKLTMAYIVFPLLLLQNKTCLKELFTLVNNTEIERNQLLTILTNFPTEYEISFDFKPTAYLNTWASIIHLTTGGNVDYYGDRTPGVWISPGNDLYVASAISGFANSDFYSKLILPINEWIQVKISQIKFTNQYIFAIEVANSSIYKTQNTLSKNFSNVKVYIGDPWYPAQPGFIRNLVIIEIHSGKSMCHKPNIKVSISGQVTNINYVAINTTISYAYETNAIAYNLTWQYMLPYFSKISSQSEDYLLMGSIYTVPGAFVTNNINQYMNVTLDMTSCSLCGDFTLEIPLKVSFNDSAGCTIDLYTSFKTNVTSYHSNLIIKRENNALKESYSRGICWDHVESWIYACMNLYVTTQKTACYFSSNFGEKWRKLDLLVGSVLGHHILTRDLYVIHRNQKTYLMYHKVYKKWLSITNNEFEKSISKNLNFSACLKLEGTYEQILTSQTQQWMGNEDGLFFRKSASDTWTRRFKWKA
ncbi:uncharacterized protein LOC124807437 isoform X2 [Hydra vulgaris]|uniref:uncharacterized protein LOC124807437 isoform X2 n=1 Tax=Hydra vulgaris TaxID=6087 RepID=UPI0032EA1A08